MNSPSDASTPANLRPRAERALINRFVALTGIAPDADGRVVDLRPLVVDTIDDDALEEAKSDIARGDGQELLWITRNDGSRRPPSLHSVFSSCGAALNNFGPWRLEPLSLEVLGVRGFE